MPEEVTEPLKKAVAEATDRAGGREGEAPRAGSGGRPSDVFGGEVRRRDLFPLLVLHLIRRDPSYGNQLIESIEDMTQGLISVNPNTMYPLLRTMEEKGLIVGSWEHPDRRTRRFYSITGPGEEEYDRLLGEMKPFLDSAIRSISLIRSEVYGQSQVVDTGG
jgi:PadR family transcriptional regulator PadR